MCCVFQMGEKIFFDSCFTLGWKWENIFYQKRERVKIFARSNSNTTRISCYTLNFIWKIKILIWVFKNIFFISHSKFTYLTNILYRCVINDMFSVLLRDFCIRDLLLWEAKSYSFYIENILYQRFQKYWSSELFGIF